MQLRVMVNSATFLSTVLFALGNLLGQNLGNHDASFTNYYGVFLAVSHVCHWIHDAGQVLNGTPCWNVVALALAWSGHTVLACQHVAMPVNAQRSHVDSVV